MALKTILMNLNNKTIRQQSKIRQLERRLKRIESGFNPIALIEPDIDEFVTGGRLINVITRNMVDEANVTDINEDDGTFSIRRSGAGTFEKRCLLRLERKIGALHGFFLNLSEIIQSFTISSSDLISSAKIEVFVRPVVDFDPTLVNWSNQPAVIGGEPFLDMSNPFSVLSGSLELDTASSGTITVKLKNNFGDNFLFPITGRWNDVKAMRVEMDATQPDGTTTSGIVTIDKLALSAASSFVVDATGVAVQCPT